jgi:periplasmic glucans biosynthesis protein
MLHTESYLFNYSRRSALRLIASSAALLASTALTPSVFAQAEPAAAEPMAFSFETLSNAMRDKAAQPYDAAVPPLPAPLETLNYDRYRMIQFRADHAKWADTNNPYQIHAFHMGWLFKEPVSMFEVEGGMASPLPFGTADFEYHETSLATELATAGWPGIAGFRINYPLNKPDKLDELVSFLGASYFRALGRGNIYGLSARGVVLNSWVDVPEEFPRFTTFYLEKPASNGPVVLYAALEGPSVAGAYRFEIQPGSDQSPETVIDVTARLYFRTDVKELGIAPLTSMFLYADNNRSDFDDYRPQVHDSNGLRVERTTGEVLWRPLNNPPTLGNSYLWENQPKSFGLFQRDRRFESYQDAGAHYERRPSLQVEPLGDWGQGNIRLIEMPSDTEADDNIGAFWIPSDPVLAGQSREFKYRLRWGELNADDKGPLGYVYDTRGGRGGVAAVESADTLRKFVIDFKGGPLDALDPATPPDILATVSGGSLKVATVSRIEANGIWRAVLDVEVHGTDVLELKAYLIGQGRQLTETWLYQWRASA